MLRFIVLLVAISSNRKNSPNKVLRSFPQLNADLVKSVTIGIIKKIPDDVYSEIVSHAL